MRPTDPHYHTKPLAQMVATKLHAGTTRVERVRKLRFKRRKKKTQPVRPTGRV